MDPIKQFTLKTLMSLSVGPVSLDITNGVVFMIVACLTPLGLGWIGLRRGGVTPQNYQALCEWPLIFIKDMLNDAKVDIKYLSFIVSIFLFILMGNVLGMMPYAFTFTSHIMATFALAMGIFVLMTVWGIMFHGAKFFTLFCPQGVPKALLVLLIPVEIISYLSRPVSLSIRLFANIMAGHTMMKVFAGFSVMMGVWGVAPLVINITLVGFEMMVAFLQAYVFSVLSCLYLKDIIDLH